MIHTILIKSKKFSQERKILGELLIRGHTELIYSIILTLLLTCCLVVNLKGVTANVISFYALDYSIGDRMSFTVEPLMLSISLDEVRVTINSVWLSFY